MSLDNGIPQTAPLGTTGASTGAAPASNFAAPQRARVTTLLGAESFGINRNAASEVLTTAREAIAALIKDMPLPADMNVKMIAIDTATYPVRLPAIVLVTSNNDVVGYHVLVLEAGGDPIEDETINTGNGQLVFARFSEQVYDGVYINAVQTTIAANYPGKVIAQDIGTACIVPRSFDFKVPANVRGLVLNALSAARLDVLREIDAVPPLDLSLPEARDGRLNVTYSFSPSTIANAVGLPQRADLRAQLFATPQQAANAATLNQGERRRPLGQGAGYIDFLWAPVTQQLGYNPMQQQSTKRFDARIVLTQLEGLANMTLHMQLLTILSMYQLAENGGWYGYFRPNLAGMSRTKGSINLKDIGALNIEGNLLGDPSGFGVPEPTDTASFDDTKLGFLLSNLVGLNPVLSMDVSVCGPDTFSNGIFYSAARNRPGAQASILKAMNELTGGMFATKYNGNEAIIPVEEWVPLGFWETMGGQADTREIDYLAIANIYGRGNPEVCAKWTNLCTNLGGDPRVRLTEMRKIIRQATGETAVFTGNALRATFRADFLRAAIESLFAVGATFQTTNPTFGGEFVANRASFEWLNSARLNSGVTGAFNQGYGGNAQSSGAMYPGMSDRRW
jgi:hypothetical protein